MSATDFDALVKALPAIAFFGVALLVVLAMLFLWIVMGELFRR